HERDVQPGKLVEVDGNRLGNSRRADVVHIHSDHQGCRNSHRAGLGSSRARGDGDMTMKANTMPSSHKIGSGKMKMSSRAGGLFAMVMCLASGASLAQERPAMTIRQGQLVSLASGISYYGSATSRTFTIASVQADFTANRRAVQVRELARGLGSEAVIAGQLSQEDYSTRVHEYVRQNLKTVFAFGQQKGSLGALLDQAGTSFDQSALLVDLLREAGISPTYQ